MCVTLLSASRNFFNMNINHYIEKGFSKVGIMYKNYQGKKKYNTYVDWGEGFSPDSASGVYLITRNTEVMKIGETEDLGHRFGCYESHSGPTNVRVRGEMEDGVDYGIFFLATPGEMVEYGGVEVPRGINYRALEKALIRQYREEMGRLPEWNRGVQ